jgi:hypothetical protein
MFRRRRREKQPRPAPQWTREKMLALLVGVTVTGLIFLLGVGLFVYYAVQPDHHAAQGDGSGAPTTSTSTTTPGEGGQPGGQDARDALAAKAMPQVAEAASHPSAVSSSSPGSPIVLPAATRVGPAGVPTGYPHTPEGAIAQLAAINQVALQSGSLGTARDVIAQWALPGGPDGQTWSGVQALESLMTDTQTAGTAQLAIVLTPLMGLVKGSVGPDFTIPCIDF